MRETIQNTNGKQFHAVSLSGGKDSSAMLLLMIEQDISIDEEFKEKILNKEATRLGKICDHTVKLLFSAFAQTVKIKISFHNLISFHRASRSLCCRAKCLL